MSAIKVKIKKKFTSPLTGKKTKIDEEINVPHNQFWLKRIEQKDCEQIKQKKKAAPKIAPKTDKIKS